jgi:hypothetical protein
LSQPLRKIFSENTVKIHEKCVTGSKRTPDTCEEDLEKIIGDDKIMERAYHELDRYSWTVEEIRTYDGIDMKRAADKAIIEGRFAEGIEKGKTEGETKKAQEIALAMIKEGDSLEKISRITGFFEKEISALKVQ